jgi:murein DD-endopeptidase MepM/ murein hydrolase activator NlpD
MHPQNTTKVKTKNVKLEVNKLHKKHPRRVEYEKSTRKSGVRRIIKDFKNGTHTYSVALLAGLVVVTPLVFMPTLAPSKPPAAVNSTADAISMGDLLAGMGGPEVVPVRTLEPLEAIKSEFAESASGFDNFFGPVVQTSFVTITKVYNHLRVANTVMPTTSPEITSSYGWRTPPCSGCSADHKGIDFVPGFGEPIFAVADGMVIDMGSNGGYGYYVRLKHLIGNSEGVIEEWETLYAHMKKDSFPAEMMIGSVVKSGDTIGAVGNTGMSTGPHLHFELIINGEHVDPLPLLGTHKVIIVSEEDYPDYMFVGQTIRVVETTVTYE